HEHRLRGEPRSHLIIDLFEDLRHGARLQPRSTLTLERHFDCRCLRAVFTKGRLLRVRCGMV
ncbi:MAG: hypothetical protein WCI74_10380, partial [Actinomycetes bacterium]